MSAFSILIDTVDNLETIKKFVETGELQRFLSRFGEVELEAAKLALSSSSIARDPAREVQAAVTHLQSAHVAFRKTYASKEFITLADETKAANMDTWVCCLMALCYRYLSEDQLVQRSLNEARDAVSIVHPRFLGKGGMFARMLTFKNYKQGLAVVLRPFHNAKAFVSLFTYIDRDELESFHSAITKSQEQDVAIEPATY